MTYLTTWLIVGLITGVIAASFVRGHGIVVDLLVGMAGAVLSGWISGTLGFKPPFVGGPGAVVVAFTGAVVLLVVVRAARQGRQMA